MRAALIPILLLLCQYAHGQYRPVYRNTKGRPCTKQEGVACKICGG